MAFDSATLVFLLLGGLAGGFVTGLAGFGTGLAAAGVWFHALEPATVPPLVALVSIGGQAVASLSVRHAFDRRRAAPYLLGGIAGVPLGVALLAVASPDMLRLAVGLLLVVYTLLSIARRLPVPPSSRAADAAVGFGGGALGGFAGLSGPLPVIWLRLQGGSTETQRAVYQPFNLLVLALAAAAMAASGAMDATALQAAAICLPAALAAAWIGARLYQRIDATLFHRIVTALLCLSGLILIVEVVFSPKV
ncbi:MAG: sulfite exporter TauE/SafE family protein [Alphaproteobacteria bacterium]|nr:sulfite exporter TauE/SafE family protein [Alphaproteobacteria bacterium]MCY4229896.1 sulfite exporter TauE/SafE family protein [Alphaproteobacteria bacterium]